MTARRTLLLVDGGTETLEDVSARLRGFGYRVLRAKTLDAGLERLAEPRFEIGAAVVPPDLPAFDLERALLAFRGAHPGAALSMLAVGSKPDAETLERLRRAGVAWALWRPIDDNALRFQANRVLSGMHPSAPRRAERVPTNWPVTIGFGLRRKTAELYSLSARGAYLATGRPSMLRSLVHVSLPLPEGNVRLAGTVVMTNVPGNLSKRNLPLGMGVCFTGHGPQEEEAILAYTRERAETLRV